MSRVPTVRKADLDRVLKALKDAGMAVAQIDVRPGGTVVIVPGGAGEPRSSPLTDTGPNDQPADLDDYRKRKRGLRAPEGA